MTCLQDVKYLLANGIPYQRVTIARPDCSVFGGVQRFLGALRKPHCAVNNKVPDATPPAPTKLEGPQDLTDEVWHPPVALQVSWTHMHAALPAVPYVAPALLFSVLLPCCCGSTGGAVVPQEVLCRLTSGPGPCPSRLRFSFASSRLRFRLHPPWD